MTNLSVVILTGNERLHIRRCLERLRPLCPAEVWVVDSESTDGTAELAREGGARVVTHPYPGYQAAQFQWALENLPLVADWVLRLDADEYLTEELIAEIKARLPQLGAEVAGVVLKRRHLWRGQWMRRGMYPTRILRLFRRGRGRSDGKKMDEHIVVDGSVVEFDRDFVDHSLIPLEAWKAKHRGYARREAESVLAGETSTGALAARKAAYYRLPRYLRVLFYWGLRFFVRGAVLEGPKAWEFCWRHALWYRWLVDREIGLRSVTSE